ncbi:ABC transporter ATP-binding protein [Pusillimonas noertemannii]|uniref:Branched-chain amino acid transport system ATP-binding protein n=1 Tax=Pusillimonas noertemannii TaxID=305977 RepID=A0A2U1CP65_9BURK|nr:ABC transporter ATP-binding protein [Pusillimonas noertemannii]NYT67003.1 ABC transporter ATP-binding protein [Pusillimonas noertemannii]PVY67676.1 branched-chain amino acid transport system ATP-binding protein [Pusillimonas noertemannii]TFL12785.1 ABC transporter ATP-binding protein [Pusillimonas noertemannii]
MSEVVLETRDLNRSFGALVVTDKVNFTLRAGARHALIGPNGAGKTTFVNLLTGKLAPSSGQVLMFGEDITGLSEYQRVKKGMARTFQINALFMDMTVLENVALAVSEHQGTAWKLFKPLGKMDSVIEAAYAQLCMLGIEAYAARAVRELSYGLQRLVEIAIALSLNPRILLLDEPAAGVPASESGIILSALDRLDPSIAIMIIEHDMALVFRFADEITVLERGRVVAHGTPQEISTNEHVRSIYFGERQVAHG